MSVSISRSGGNVTATVTADVRDILADDDLTAPEKKQAALLRLVDTLNAAYHAERKTTREVDDEATAAKAAIDARAAAVKAAKASGSI